MKKLILILLMFSGFASYGQDQTIGKRTNRVVVLGKLAVDTVVYDATIGDTVLVQAPDGTLRKKILRGAVQGTNIDSLTFHASTLCVYLTEQEPQCFPFTRFICYERDNFDGTKTIGYNCNDEAVDSTSNHTKWFKAGPNIAITPYGAYGDSILFASTGGSGSSRLDGLIVSHDTLYKYDFTAGTGVINDTLYTTVGGSVTLQHSDGTFDRIDVIADSLGIIVVKPGTPSANPQEPQLNPSQEIPLTRIIVKAGTTAPDNISRIVVYDENISSPTEWTHAKTGPFTVDFASTATPFHLSKAIDIGTWSGTTNSITFTSATKVNVADGPTIKLAVNLKAALPSNAYIYLRVMNGTAGVIPFVSLTSYGLNNSILGYQNVTIPVTQLNPTDVQYDKIQMLFYGPSGGAYMDYIQLQGGVANPTGGGIKSLYRKAGKDSIYWINPATGLETSIKDSTGSSSGGTVTVFSKVDGFGITSSVANPTTTPSHTIAADTTASGLSGKYFRISDTTNKWLQFAGLSAGGDSLYVVKNGVRTATKIVAAGGLDSSLFKNNGTIYGAGDRTVNQAGKQLIFTGGKTIFDSLRMGATPTIVGPLITTPSFATSMPTGWAAHGSTTLGLTHDGTGLTIVGAPYWTQPSSGSITTAYRAGLVFNLKHVMMYEKLKIVVTLIPKNKVAGGAVAIATGNMGLNYNTSPNMVFDLSNGPGSGAGRPGFDTLTNANLGDSVMRLSFSTDDTLQLIAEKDGWGLTGALYDQNSGARVSNSFNINWNSTGGLLNLVFLKGTFKLLSVNVSSWNKKDVPYFLSTSMWSGSGNTSMQRRTPSIVMNNDVDKFEVIGLPSIETKYFVQAGLIQEIIDAAHPSYVVYNLNFNDKSANEGAPVTNVATDTIFTRLIAAGIPVAATSLQPRAGLTTDIYNDSLQALTLRRGLIFIDTRTPLTKASGALDENYSWDLLHINDTGSIKEARAIIAAIGDRINPPTAKDLTPIATFNNVPIAPVSSVVALYGKNSKGELVQVANFLPSINKWVLANDNTQSYSGSSYSSTAAQPGGIHMIKDITTDSAFNSNNPNGLYFGFAGPNLTTRRNVVFDAGTASGVSGQRFASITGTGNIFFHMGNGVGTGFTGSTNFIHTTSNITGYTGSNTTCLSCAVFAGTTGSNWFGWGPQSLKGMTTGNSVIDFNYNQAGSDVSYNLSNHILFGDGLTHTNYARISNSISLAAGYFGGTTLFVGGGTIGVNNAAIQFAGRDGTNSPGWDGKFIAPPGTGANIAGKFLFEVYSPTTTGSTSHSTKVDKMVIDPLGAAIGTSSITDHVPDAALEIKSTTQGLVLPRMTKAQRDLVGMGLATLATNAAGSGATNGFAIITFTGGGCTVQPVGSCQISGGAVVAGSAKIVSTGSGCTSAPTGTIATGTGATFTPTIGPTAGNIIYQTDNTPGIRTWNGTNWMKYSETAD